MDQHVWEYNLSLLENAQRDPVERCVNCSKGDKTKASVLCTLPSSIWYALIWWWLSLRLRLCLSLLTLSIQKNLSFCLFNWSQMAYSLFNDWLTSIRKHFINARYSKQVRQRCEDSLRLSRMDFQDLIMLKSNWLCLVSARFECMLSPESWANYSWYEHKYNPEILNLLRMCLLYDAQIHLP